MQSTDQSPTSPQRPRPLHFFGDLIRFAVIALIIVIPFRLFIAQPFIVNGASMVPTFHSGEYLIVDQVTYRFDDPSRGDVVVFRYPENPSRFYIKRVIGLPGETVVIDDSDVLILNDRHPEGIQLTEPYIEASGQVNIRRTLGDDEYFVLGDNRRHSSDSRRWGALKRKYIEGRPAVRLFPVNELDVLPGVYTFTKD